MQPMLEQQRHAKHAALGNMALAMNIEQAKSKDGRAAGQQQYTANKGRLPARLQQFHCRCTGWGSASTETASSRRRRAVNSSAARAS